MYMRTIIGFPEFKERPASLPIFKKEPKKMDKGAHYYKCDFQVHSPRDINWTGTRPLNEDERKTYAEDLSRNVEN